MLNEGGQDDPDPGGIQLRCACDLAAIVGRTLGVNASPLILLARIGRLNLLASLGDQLVVPKGRDPRDPGRFRPRRNGRQDQRSGPSSFKLTTAGHASLDWSCILLIVGSSYYLHRGEACP